MNELEKNLFKDSVKAYTEEEKLEAIKLIPSDYLWDELINRNTKMLQRINFVEETLGVSLDNIHPIPAMAWDDIRYRYTDTEDKFKKVMKGFGA